MYALLREDTSTASDLSSRSNWKFIPYSKQGLSYIRDCLLRVNELFEGKIPDSWAVLIDNKGHIRGFFNPSDPDDFRKGLAEGYILQDLYSRSAQEREERAPMSASSRRAFLLWVVLPSTIVPLTISLLFVVPQALRLGEWVHLLPHIHASVNTSTALLLLLALWAIRRRRPRLHKQLIYVCLGLGVLFLLSYLLYHSSVPSVIYGDKKWRRNT